MAAYYQNLARYRSKTILLTCPRTLMLLDRFNIVPFDCRFALNLILLSNGCISLLIAELHICYLPFFTRNIRYYNPANDQLLLLNQPAYIMIGPIITYALSLHITTSSLLLSPFSSPLL